MSETAVMSDFEPGTIRPEIEGYTALRIAKLCGYSSDRWTRDRRSELEQMLLQCRNGHGLVEALKMPDGKLYTLFALQLIQDYQRCTSTAIPQLKNGQPVLDKTGKAKLQTVERRMLQDDFAQMLIERYGKASDDEDLDPEADPEFRPEIPGELVDEDPDLTSTALVWQRQESTAAIEVADSNAAIASDTRRTLMGFRQQVVQAFGQLGAEDGAAAVQNYALNFQQQLNQGLTDLNGVKQSDDKPKTARRATRKKPS